MDDILPEFLKFQKLTRLDAYSQFIKDSGIKAFDLEHRRKINFNMAKYDSAVLNGKKQYKEIEKARNRAGFLKYKVINDLDKYLIKFEDNFNANGGKVIWAQDKKEAIKEILEIAKENNIQKVVKTKSMTTEEIELNDAFTKKKIDSVETDLGEYIVQLANEKPYHIVTPAMHKSKEDVADLFNEKFNTDKDASPEEITEFVRNLLREKFIEANMGISGANFLISDIGGIALTENEGNGMMTMSFPKVHIVIAGIEKLIPRLLDLDLFLPLLATHGTGQNISVYNSIITGPKKANEIDGPEKMYVILLDNKRTNLLAQERQRRALSCIRCGACLNACPVYKNIGGHTYNTTYSGPIGAVINPFMLDLKEYKHQSFASTICGKCTEVCPVKIPLHELLLVNRNEAVKRKHYSTKDKLSILTWKKIMSSRKKMDMLGGKSKNLLLKNLYKKAWGTHREIPKVEEKSFNQLWKEQNSKE